MSNCEHQTSADATPVQQSIEELTAQRDMLADILTRTANALKGPPAELSAHSWHDLPEVAQRLKAAQQQEPVNIGCEIKMDFAAKNDKRLEQQPVAGRAIYEDGDVFERIAAMKKAPQRKQLPLTDVDYVNACMSYRHDFGLMTQEQRDKLIFQAREWARAFGMNEAAHGIKVGA